MTEPYDSGSPGTWPRGNVSMDCGMLPGRKRPCLWIQRGGAIHVIGYFVSPEAMREFLALKPTYTRTAGAESSHTTQDTET